MPVYPKNEAVRFLNRLEKPIEKIFEAIQLYEHQLTKVVNQFPKEEQTDDPKKLEAINKKYSTIFTNPPFLMSLKEKFEVFAKKQNSAFLFNSYVFSLGALNGAILQIAKQLISFPYKNNCRTIRKGRKIAGMHLPQIIFDARNQSLHFEENRVTAKTLETFKKLQKQFGDRFNCENHPERNYARDVVKLIGWTNSNQFMKDLEEILK